VHPDRCIDRRSLPFNVMTIASFFVAGFVLVFYASGFAILVAAAIFIWLMLLDELKERQLFKKLAEKSRDD
jgi:phosphatidylglycerophosphate synthase